MSEFSQNTSKPNNFQIYEWNNLVDDLDENLQVLPNEITETNTEAWINASLDSWSTNTSANVTWWDGLATVNDAPELVEKIVMDLIKSGITPWSTGWNEAISEYTASFWTESWNTIQSNTQQIFQNAFTSLSGQSTSTADQWVNISQQISAEYNVAWFTDSPEIVQKVVIDLIKQWFVPWSTGWNEAVSDYNSNFSWESSVGLSQTNEIFEDTFLTILNQSLGWTVDGVSSLQWISFSDTTSLSSLISKLQWSIQEWSWFINHGQFEYPIVTEVTWEDYIRISRYRDNMRKDHRMIRLEDLINSIEQTLINPKWGQIVWDISDQEDLQNLLDQKVNITDLWSTLTLYPTTVASDIWGYYKLVSDISDVAYDDPSVDVPTGAISWSDQLISSLVSAPWLIVGTPWVVNLTIVGNIRKVTWATSTNATFHFHLFKRDSLGNEVEIGVSDNTEVVINSTYNEFSASLLFNDGVWLSTDRIVFKFYWSKVWSWTAPTYEFQFWWETPVRAILPVPVSVLLSDYLQQSFESYNKNIRAYPYNIVETSWTVTTITYTTWGGPIVKTITEVSDTITTIVLSGIPAGIPTTKTINNWVVTYS